MSWMPNAEWSLRILSNHRREDPLNVEMAIEYASTALRREIKTQQDAETSGDPTYEHDEPLQEALRQC